MKDASSRFGLEQYTAKIKRLSNDSNAYLIILGVGLFFIFTTTSVALSQADKTEQERSLSMMTKVHKRKTIESETQ